MNKIMALLANLVLGVLTLLALASTSECASETIQPRTLNPSNLFKLAEPLQSVREGRQFHHEHNEHHHHHELLLRLRSIVFILSTVQERLEFLARQGEQLQTRVDTLNDSDDIALQASINALLSRVTALETGENGEAALFTALTNKDILFASQIASLQTSVSDFLTRIIALEADEDAEAALISTLSSNYNAIASQITTIFATLNDHKARIIALEADEAAEHAAIATLQNNYALLLSRVNALENSLTSLTGRVTTVEGQVQTLIAEEEAEDARITNLENLISRTGCSAAATAHGAKMVGPYCVSVEGGTASSPDASYEEAERQCFLKGAQLVEPLFTDNMFYTNLHTAFATQIDAMTTGLYVGIRSVSSTYQYNSNGVQILDSALFWVAGSSSGGSGKAAYIKTPHSSIPSRYLTRGSSESTPRGFICQYLN